MIQPTGFHVLIRPDPVETKSEGGIILAVNEKIEKHQTDTGVIVGIGDCAWHDKAEGFAWAKIGDRVNYAKHAGKFVTDEETDEEFLIVNDEDVLAIQRGPNG